MNTAIPDRTTRRRRARIGAAVAVPATVGLVVGCGSAGAPTAAATEPGTAFATRSTPADPEMTMVTLSDLGYRTSDIGVHVRQTMMLMVVNRGTHAHELRASLPLAGMHIENPSSPSASDPGEPASTTGFDVTVPAGQEIDVTFAPTAAGRYPMRDGSASVSALVVG